MQHSLAVRMSAAVGLAFALAAADAWAQGAPPVRVRGTIEKVDGPLLTVKSREGKELRIRLAENATVRGIVKVSLADVKVGAYVGASGIPQPDGSQRAIHVHIFPPEMRGVAEGFRPWDNQPGPP